MKLCRYKIGYKMSSSSSPKICTVRAKSKIDAWEFATFDYIPYIENEHPYSAWVESVTYSNGKEHIFNNFEGKPY